MNSQNETGTVSKLMLRVMVPSALLLWTFVATGTVDNVSNLDGRYRPSGHVLLSDGRVAQVSQTLVFNKGRFYSMTHNAPAIFESSGRLETDLLGRASLVVEKGQVSGLGADSKIDDELMFNLVYGKH